MGPDRNALPKTTREILPRLNDPVDILALRLSDDVKIRLLQQWRYDVVQLHVGATECMDSRLSDAELLPKIDRVLRPLLIASRRAHDEREARQRSFG